MKKRIDEQITMFHAVNDLYTSEQPRFDVVPAIVTDMQAFTDRTELIAELLPGASENTKPTTQAKDELLLRLCKAAVLVSQAVQAYADSIGDIELYGSMNWTETKTFKMRKDLVGPTCEAIHKKGTEFKAQAEPFNLTQAKLDELSKLIQDWNSKQAITRAKQVAISGLKKQVAELVSENMKLLTRRLDRTVATLSESDPALVALWEQTRKTMHMPTTETQLRVMVEADGEPKEDAEVFLVNGKEFRAVTNSDGEAIYRPLKQGMFLLKVLAPGFKLYEMKELCVLLGHVNRVAVALLPE